jgi:hypothetical protein
MSEAAAIIECYTAHSQQPQDCKCTQDKYDCPQQTFLWGLGTFSATVKYTCGKQTGLISDAIGETINCGAGFICKSGLGQNGGCVSCFAPQPDGAPAVLQHDIIAPGDPNQMTGPPGDVVPGQWLTYTIEFANVGQAPAYGVYVTNQLDPVFDEDSLNLMGAGQYLTATRTLVWDVGTLGISGTLTATGTVSYAVQLRGGLPSGTLVVNRAVVHFPTVPQDTPTNPVVNIVEPLSALPQSLQTPYGQPLHFSLQGLAAGGGPLTYTIVRPPLFGVLAGLGATYTYTPMQNFNGLDQFLFRVSNALTASLPAEVEIVVTPSAADTIPPRVQATAPMSGAVDIPIKTTPFLTDSVGPAYVPFINVQFSEPIDASTVSTQTITMRDSAGHPVAVSVLYDPILRQAVVTLRQPLRAGGTYTLIVARGVKDLAGNPMVANYQWSFRASGGAQLFLPLIRR